MIMLNISDLSIEEINNLKAKKSQQIEYLKEIIKELEDDIKYFDQEIELRHC